LNALRDVETLLLPNALKAENGSRAAMCLRWRIFNWRRQNVKSN
jgi:hypothetical protein